MDQYPIISSTINQAHFDVVQSLRLLDKTWHSLISERFSTLWEKTYKTLKNNKTPIKHTLDNDNGFCARFCFHFGIVFIARNVGSRIVIQVRSFLEPLTSLLEFEFEETRFDQCSIFFIPSVYSVTGSERHLIGFWNFNAKTVKLVDYTQFPIISSSQHDLDFVEHEDIVFFHTIHKTISMILPSLIHDFVRNIGLLWYDIELLPNRKYPNTMWFHKRISDKIMVFLMVKSGNEIVEKTVHLDFSKFICFLAVFYDEFLLLRNTNSITIYKFNSLTTFVIHGTDFIDYCGKAMELKYPYILLMYQNKRVQGAASLMIIDLLGGKIITNMVETKLNLVHYSLAKTSSVCIKDRIRIQFWDDRTQKVEQILLHLPKI
jgi:hypothetical protein